MQLFLLREEPAGSAIFVMTGEALDSTAEAAAATCTARQATEGRRFGLMPYSAMAPVDTSLAASQAIVPADNTWSELSELK